MCGGGGNHRGQSKSRWPAAWGAGTSVGSPTCAPLNAPTRAASRAASAATLIFPGWTPGMPCVVCLRGHPADAVPLRATFGHLGVGLPACGARPPLCVGSLREARRATCGHPCRLRSLRSRRRHCPPLVGLTSVRLSPPPRLVHSAALRARAAAGFDSLRSLHAATLRSGHSATPLRRGLQSGGRAP